MKKFKQLMKLAAFLFAFSFLFTICTTAEAASSQKPEGQIFVNPYYNSYKGTYTWKSVTKMRVTENSIDSFDVYYGRQGDYISDLKVNKKGLTAEVTYHDSSEWSSYSYDCYGVISLAADKQGTYKVSFKVRKADGSIAGSYSVKVYCIRNSGIYNTAKLNKTTIYKRIVKKKGNTTTRNTKSNYKVSSTLKSAKLKLTANKGYSITGMLVVSTNANGKKVVKSVKNGKSINLSRQYSYRTYKEDGTSSRSNRIYTNIFVSYKDKYLGTYVKYSATKKHGIKEIKRVEKCPDGTVNTSYYDIDDYGDITLWRY